MQARSLALALMALSLPQMMGAALSAASMPTADAMRWHRRILLIAAPGPQNPQAVAQKRILRDWSSQAADHDIALVELSGTQVTGLANPASALRRRYGIAPGRFEVLLIGKDGTVALRSARPIPAARLQSTIDAMPMRRAGER
jgi:hypothetical protein